MVSKISVMIRYDTI